MGERKGRLVSRLFKNQLLKKGDIILIPYPFAELSNVKVRPALVLAITQDKFKDIVLAAITSVVPEEPSKNDLLILPSEQNKLRTKSIIKLDRLFTLKRENVLADLGKLQPEQWSLVKVIFRNLVA